MSSSVTTRTRSTKIRRPFPGAGEGGWSICPQGIPTVFKGCVWILTTLRLPNMSRAVRRISCSRASLPTEASWHAIVCSPCSIKLRFPRKCGSEFALTSPGIFARQISVLVWTRIAGVVRQPAARRCRGPGPELRSFESGDFYDRESLQRPQNTAARVRITSRTASTNESSLASSTASESAMNPRGAM